MQSNLAIEVVSPGDDSELLDTRIDRHLHYGTEQAWGFYPRTRKVPVFRRDLPDTMCVYREDQRFVAEALLPGLVISARDLFVVPPLDP